MHRWRPAPAPDGAAFADDAVDQRRLHIAGQLVGHLARAGICPPPYSSIRAPMLVRDARVRIDLPVANTVFWLRKPHSTWRRNHQEIEQIPSAPIEHFLLVDAGGVAHWRRPPPWRTMTLKIPTRRPILPSNISR